MGEKVNPKNQNALIFIMDFNRGVGNRAAFILWFSMILIYGGFFP